MNTYINLVAASNAAFRDPQHVGLRTINSYTAGQAKLEYDQSLTAAKKQGIAYKGTPSTPRLTVVSSSLGGSLPSVVLRDCGLASTTDPFVGYYVATGKPVPTTAPKVPPPYAKTIKMFQPNRKSCVITSLTTDPTKSSRRGAGGGGSGSGGPGLQGPSGAGAVNASAPAASSGAAAAGSAGAGAAGGGAAAAGAAGGPPGMAIGAAVQAVGAVKGMAESAAASGTQEK